MEIGGVLAGYPFALLGGGGMLEKILGGLCHYDYRD